VVRRLETLAADAETLKAYLRQIAGMPRLTVEEERDLARRVRQHGDEQALSRLVESNLRVVVSYARRFRPLGLPALDLIHEGNLGLIEAARRYDPESRQPFLAFAFWWIREAMLHLFASEAADVTQEHDGAGLHMAALQLAIERGPVSTGIVDDLVADDDELPPPVTVMSQVPWAGQHLEQREDETLESAVLVAVRPPDADDQLTRDALAYTFEAQLADVDPRARQILRLRAGLHGGDPWTVEQVAGKLGLSVKRVASIEAEARHTLSRQRALDSHLN